jgi:hypothetical protein
MDLGPYTNAVTVQSSPTYCRFGPAILGGSRGGAIARQGEPPQGAHEWAMLANPAGRSKK